jgi:nucleoside-diphosphate-sugar epimerase
MIGQLSPTGRQVVITGSSGFIGGHLCRMLRRAYGDAQIAGIDRSPPLDSCDVQYIRADLRYADEVQRIFSICPDSVFHLAALTQSIIPLSLLMNLVADNVAATVNILKHLTASRLLFASSSAVYGHCADGIADESWSNINPRGTYGTSKVLCELAISDWVQETGSTAISFRFGNVVGPGARGLIPYLVNHACRFPDGSEPAQCRGSGCVLRDYVPVTHAAKALMTGLKIQLPSGTHVALNVGTGKPVTNGWVARVVTRQLSLKGYKLHIDFANPLIESESRQVVLKSEKLTELTGLIPPSLEEVESAIEQAVDFELETHPNDFFSMVSDLAASARRAQDDRAPRRALQNP